MADHVYNTRRRNIKQKEALEEESDDSIDDSTTSLDNSDSKLPKRRGRPSKKSDSKKSRTQSNKTSMKPKKNPKKNPKKVKVTSKENTDYAALVQKNIEERNAIFASLFRDLAVGETKNIEKNKKKIQRQMPDNEKTENEPPKKRVKIWRKISKSVSETSSSNLEDEVIPKYNTRSRNKEIPRRNMKELDSEDSFSEKFPSLSDSGDSSFLVNGISDRDWISVRDVGPMTRKQLMLQKKLIATEEDNGNKGNLEPTITSQQEKENAKENEEQKADEKESHAMDECPSFTSSKISTTDDEANSKDQTYEPSLSSQEEINENTDIVKAVIISQPEENGQKNEQQNADEKESHAMDENSSFTSSKISTTDDEANSKDQKTHQPSISGKEEIDENTDIVKLDENDANVSSADVNNEENIVEQIDAINPGNEKVEAENKVEIDTEKPDDKKEVM